MRSVRGLAAVLVLLSVASACDSGDPEAIPVRSPVPTPESSAGPVIGVVGTMAGSHAQRGTDAFEGADLAIHLLNQSSRSSELPFGLVTLDDGGDPQEATRLVEELAADERTVGIVYAGPPEGLPPAADALEAAGIPAFLVNGDLYSARLLRPALFQVSPPLLWQARRIMAYLTRDRGYRRLGVLVSEGLAGDTALASLRSALPGRVRVLPERYDPAAEPAFDDLVQSYKRRRVEAIVVDGSNLTLLGLVRALAERGAEYSTTADARTVTAPKSRRGKKTRKDLRGWAPQIAAFDEAMYPLETAQLPAGTVISETYARGAYYLPVGEFKNFASDFRDWWDAEPLGWERRSYEAVSLLGWAARRTEPDESLLATLERARQVRFGGIRITLGPDDHTTAEQTAVGLWVVPRSGIDVPERDSVPTALPWVPLGRGFSTNGDRSDIFPEDWRALFRNPPPSDGPGPRIGSARFGVTTGRKDPVH